MISQYQTGGFVIISRPVRHKLMATKLSRLRPPRKIASHALLLVLLLVGLVRPVIGEELPLENVVRIEDQSIRAEKRVDLSLPALPAKTGKLIVLRCRVVSYAKSVAGCNYNGRIEINGSPLSRRTATGSERLIGREPLFGFVSEPASSRRVFQIFSGPNLMTIYAPDVDACDKATVDGKGSRHVFDISDLASGVDGNTLTFHNLRKQYGPVARLDLIVTDIQVGYLDRNRLPQTTRPIPKRGTIEATARLDSLQLRQGKAGGFTVTTARGLELLVETTLAMNSDAPSDLIADDSIPKDSRSKTVIKQTNAHSFQTEATWPHAKLKRTVAIRDGLVEWTERWTNTTDRNIGIPFRHRMFLRNGTSRFVMGGDADSPALAGSPMNPTVLIEREETPGMALGVTSESDWLRLLMSTSSSGGIGEIFTRTLALAPGKSIDLRLTITPVDDGGGYWSFINSLRQRWGVNHYTMPRPVFLGYRSTPVRQSDEDDAIKSLSHLGPITVALGPWGRLQADAYTVRSGAYPKLPDDAPRTPGKCPDLDVDKFLTFSHRKTFHDQFQQRAAAIRQACPNVRIIQLMHPSIEAIYKPLAHRWPWHSEGIGTPDGGIFGSYAYSRSWLQNYTGKDWGVQYYVPRSGARYLKALLKSVRLSMDEHNSDGIYFDEFSWAGRSRGYSRYDYSRWDGRSADLDENGEVLRLKSDNAFVSESAQLQLAHATLSRDGFFLGNGAAALSSVNRLPIARFIEGGNGHGYMAAGHLSTVPLVLGNFGDESSQKSVFDAVKECLSVGCVYSPTAVYDLLEGPDNFVCKLYPIRIRRIQANTILGDQRLITSRPGEFDWPGRAARVRLFEYDDQGNLTDKSQLIQTKADAKLRIEVPKDGMVIAEVIPPPLVFVITGESNSGGLGRNADASPKERAPRACVQIMNLSDGIFGFEDLQLGVNNLRDHHRLQDFYDNRHGFENELANAVEAGSFPGHDQVYLIKTGQGGSRISQWTEQHPSGFWKKFVQRIEAGKKQLPADPQWVVWFSLGINDGIDGAAVDAWKRNVRAHLKRIKAQLPGVVIVMTQFQSMGYQDINAAIADIANNDASVFAVDSTGAKLADKNHWNYSGLKTVTQRMVEMTRKRIAEHP